MTISLPINPPETKECYKCSYPIEGVEGECIESDCEANCLITCECGTVNDSNHVEVCQCGGEV